MRTVRALGRFVYDLVVGDDWRIAVGTALSLVLGLLLLVLGAPAPLAALAVAVLLGATLAAGLALDVRAAGARHQPDR